MALAFVPCQHCQGFGEVRHPRWGSYDCPEPTAECPECDGTGGYTVDERADLDAEALDDWRRGVA